ncbi:hypothetical protein [Paucibacter soli]|uniref:hypothetical protein n=1 Tax=Paucibacter soli TaxID=3133433 RepID=UPI0030A3D475
MEIQTMTLSEHQTKLVDKLLSRARALSKSGANDVAINEGILFMKAARRLWLAADKMDYYRLYPPGPGTASNRARYEMAQATRALQAAEKHAEKMLKAPKK